MCASLKTSAIFTHSKVRIIYIMLNFISVSSRIFLNAPKITEKPTA